MNQPIAIQSWCLRAFKPLPQFLEQLKSVGVTATELCGIHADFNDPSTFPAIADQFAKAKVQIVAIGVEAMTGDFSRDRSKFEFCKAVGAKNMSITFSPDAWFDGKLKAVEKLAEEFNIRCGIHNHGGYDWLGNASILKHVFSRTSKQIGLHMDTAWALDAGEKPIQWVEQFADRLHGIHIKDFTFDRAAHPSDVIIGAGNLDLPRLIGDLKKINFTGPLVIEYEGDEAHPQPALSECVQVLKKLM